MKVSVMPFAVHDHKICSIYKLEMVLYTPENYPKNTDISLEDWEETLEVVFVRELEDAIQNHLLLLSKISGIKNFMPDSQSHASNGTDDDDVSGNRLQREEENDYRHLEHNADSQHHVHEKIEILHHRNHRHDVARHTET